MTAGAIGSSEGTIRFFDNGQYVAVHGAGYWTPAYVDTHFAELGELLARVRRQKHVRVLVDLTQAAVQGEESAQRVSHWTARLYREGDRVAIVLASSLLKAQMRRVAIIADRELFLSRTAAMTWLLATPEG